MIVRTLWIASTVLISNLVIAEGRWEPIPNSRIEDTATNPEKVAQVFERNGRHDIGWIFTRNAARVAAGLPPIIYLSIRLVTTRYQWIGETKCDAGDKRLKQKQTAGSACILEGTKRSCSQWVPTIAQADPCA